MRGKLQQMTASTTQSDQFGSISETDGIRVSVTPRFVPEQSGDGQWLFTYWVKIENVGDRWAKVRRRYWEISDADGGLKTVDDVGVVGEEPELEAGDSFEYSSWCPLETPWGTMQGHYTLERRDGEVFTAAIDRFYLVSGPQTVRAADDLGRNPAG